MFRKLSWIEEKDMVMVMEGGTKASSYYFLKKIFDFARAVFALSIEEAKEKFLAV